MPFILEDVGDTMHEWLHVVYRHLPTDFEPYGRRVRTAGPMARVAASTF
jgi:hypothetical protein